MRKDEESESIIITKLEVKEKLCFVYIGRERQNCDAWIMLLLHAVLLCTAPQETKERISS